jgi:membrane protease YdiL (CAAX protease family)
MDLLCIYVVVLGYIGLTMYLANQTDLAKQIKDHHHIEDSVTIYDRDYDKQAKAMRGLLYLGVSIIGMLGLFVFLAWLSSGQTLEDGTTTGIEISTLNMILGVVMAGAFAFAGYNVTSTYRARAQLAQWIGNSGRFDPHSHVHTTAVILSLLLVGSQVAQLIMIGGTEGLAESIEESGIDAGLVLFQMVIQVLAAFLGIGWAIRRDVPQALARLGLRVPTNDDLRWGIGGGLMMYGALLAFNVVLTLVMAVISPEFLEETNAANANFAAAIDTLALALLVAGAAGIGEEILFRGALQPVFGNVLTSIIFALLHIQVLFSPSILFLFALSYILGIIRDRHSTTAAILAHFVYNFVQMFLLIVLSGAAA